MGRAATGLPRPHSLFVQQSMPVGKDANGFELPHATEWVFWCACRDQPLGHSREVRGANGESYFYSSAVFADLGTPWIENGTRIDNISQAPYCIWVPECERRFLV
jgi:hypothetical protein